MKSPSEWIDTLAQHQNRQYYRDQTPESLEVLIELARDYKPTIIVELGTCFGLSLRAWIAANTAARIVAIDKTFKHLRAGLKALPMDLSRIINLVEKDIEDVDFSSLWRDSDRVLLYCDVHGDALMAHILSHAIDLLPENSLVIVDDVWYNKKELDSTSARQFFEDAVSQQTDPEISQDHQPRHFARYWAGGSFFGFEEVPRLCRYLNQVRINAKFESKVLWWIT
uniref:Putative methyltransferase n=1 Tax=viral metagenome TaxID=1070528 RepID=A0A6M3LU55_9ZZZZ